MTDDRTDVWESPEDITPKVHGDARSALSGELKTLRERRARDVCDFPKKPGSRGERNRLWTWAQFSARGK
ncbi:hypothetical protein AAFF_G00231530 [Aldrovandia affinis]|uniref:Uncharacterized protein n=1 Tax=Aldrovandia affinis TaxID=143900 RepID=A0AAD7RF62_9TELE|nr:hypothetical protein AAFF_G00231530 [Aldrovandia affinis]